MGLRTWLGLKRTRTEIRPPHMPPRRTEYVDQVVKDLAGTHDVTCNICGFVGRFKAFGRPPRYNAECPSCGSLERHRLLIEWLSRNSDAFEQRRVLHFAPERIVRGFLRPRAASYISADIRPGVQDVALDVEAIALPASSTDLVVLSHIIEHVDDRKALTELFRVLSPGGTLLLMTPIVEGWPSTYENPAIVTPEDRFIHYGQHDHLRYYGRDLRDRIRAAGFELTEFAADPEMVLRHGMLRGEILFIASRPEQ